MTTNVVQRCVWCGDEFRMPLRWLRSETGGQVDTSALDAHEPTCSMRPGGAVEVDGAPLVAPAEMPAAGAVTAVRTSSPAPAGVDTIAAAAPLDVPLSVILTAGKLVNPAGGVYPLDRPAHLGEVAAVLARGRASVVFVDELASTWLELPAEAGPAPFVDDAAAVGWVIEPGELSWVVRVRRAPGEPVLSFVFLRYDVEGYAAPWSRLAGDALIDGVAAFRRAVGAAPAASVGQTGERLLLAVHNVRKGGARLDRVPGLPPAVAELAEIGSTWRRPLEPGEATPGRWVHSFDANANYLGAYQTATLGRGEPQWFNGSDSTDRLWQRRADGRWDYLPPALWRISLPAEVDDGLPVPWSTSAEWHTSPTLARARELVDEGTPLEVVEAWAWPVSSRFCEPFGALMRDARVRLLEAGDAAGAAVALEAVTMTYQRLHGRFGAAFRSSTASPWARPDWMHTIRAQARVNIDRRLRKLEIRPIALDVDAFYLIDDDPDPEIVAGRAGLPLGPRHKLGAFRPAGSVQLTDGLIAALEATGTAAGTRELLRRTHGEPPAVLAGVLAAVAERVGGVEDVAAAMADVDDGDDELAELAAYLEGGA